MSGVGGGGAMVLYRAREDQYEVIDYGMRAPDSLRAEDYPLTGEALPPTSSRGRGSRTTAICMAPARSRCPAWSPAWRKRIAATPDAVAGFARAQRQARRRRPCGRLVDHADDRKLRGRSAALSRQVPRPIWSTACRRTRNGASARRSACRRTGSRRRCPISPRKARAISIRAIWRAASPPTSRPPAARCRSRTSLLPRPSARAAGNPLSRRQGLRDAGTDRRADAGAHAAPVAAGSAARAQRPGCIGLRGLCAGAAIGLSRAAEGHGRRRRPPRARRRASGAELHHAFLGGRPRRQHGGGDANPAVDLRLEIRHAANRHHHEQRHHVVRPDAGHAELAGSPASAA